MMRNRHKYSGSKAALRAAAVFMMLLLIMMTLSSCKKDEAEYHVIEYGTVEDSVEADGSYAPGAPLMTSPHGDASEGSLPASAAAEADTDVPAFPGNPPVKPQGEAFVLTGAEWNDHANWPFFVNLVNSGTLTFPSFGLDPGNMIKVTVTDASGEPLRGETVELTDETGNLIWRAKSGKDGAAYLFFKEGDAPRYISSGDCQTELGEEPAAPDESGQGTEPSARSGEEYVITKDPSAPESAGLQIMFIVDTTGSMGDELAYLQMDFASIAEEVGGEDVYFSANFYRDDGDEYVTRTNDFTQDTGTVKDQIQAEYAEGGGDTPEAVAEILAETMGSAGWRDDCSKIAFLIFDAPPHEGTEQSIEQSVRAAAEQGIVLIPVVASNADRDTEIFGRAIAIMTGGTYIFLTDDSGVGESHLEPIVGDYTVELLHDIIVRVINDYR